MVPAGENLNAKFNFDEAIDDQIEEIELVAISRCWSSEQLYANLLLASPTELRHKITSKKVREPEKRLAEAKEEIAAYFRSHQSCDRLFSEFENASLAPSTTIEEFYKKMEDLLKKARPNLSKDDREFFLRKKIIDCLHPDDRRHVLAQSKGPCQNFLEVAQIYQDHRSLPVCATSYQHNSESKAEKCVMGPENDKNTETMLDRIEEALKKLSVSADTPRAGCNKCGSRNHDTDQCQGRAFCKICQKNGHLTSFCKLYDPKRYFDRFYSASLVNNGVPLIPVSIKNSQLMLSALVDTGSCVSIIKNDFAQLGSPLEKVSCSFSSVNGQRITPEGVTRLTFSISGIEYGWSFYCIKDSEFDIIIGRDFILHHKLIVDLSRDMILSQNFNEINAIERKTNTKTIDSLISKWYTLFSQSSGDNGRTSLVEHKIDTGNSGPIKVQPYRIPLAKKEQVCHAIPEILDNGPLPTTKNGNRFIIVFTNHHTRWVEAKPVPNQTTETAVEAMFECVICRFGIPEQIHSDQGTQFEAQMFSDICKRLGIKKSRTTPYHPQGNGSVERSNRTIKEALRHFVDSHQSNWDKYLPTVLFAMRAATNSTTGYSPAELTFGRKIKTVLDIETNPQQESASNLPKDYGTFYEKIKDELAKIQNAAKLVIERRTQQQLDSHSKKCRINEYCIGDHVLLRSQRQNKLQPIFHGPYEIVKASHPNYSIMTKDKPATLRKLHHDLLYPYNNKHNINEDESFQAGGGNVTNNPVDYLRLE
ncbi:Retrovirus-related Pol polyprotein [Thelohanellus kitauei]|uniref:Retrovirus-related Pol polyprotein n=2 Tax=Thelohanellus kitauei TaxID=669202 RepID=A0A0C2J1L1_THEKT|nr:Retrovirus-related Pol polyprotein [Thelohanellus kitauei]